MNLCFGAKKPECPTVTGHSGRGYFIHILASSSSHHFLAGSGVDLVSAVVSWSLSL